MTLQTETLVQSKWVVYKKNNCIVTLDFNYLQANQPAVQNNTCEHGEKEKNNLWSQTEMSHVSVMCLTWVEWWSVGVQEPHSSLTRGEHSSLTSCWYTGRSSPTGLSLMSHKHLKERHLSRTSRHTSLLGTWHIWCKFIALITNRTHPKALPNNTKQLLHRGLHRLQRSFRAISRGPPASKKDLI